MNNSRTVAFLMGSLGVEVESIYSAKNFSNAEKSYERMLRIVNALKAKKELKNRTYEIDMICKIVLDKLSGKPQLHVTAEDLQSYFMPFAMRALTQ